MSDDGICCSGPSGCCGAGSWCCTHNPVRHRHEDELIDEQQMVIPLLRQAGWIGEAE